MRRHNLMMARLFIGLVVCLASASPALADATLFRVYLVDGSSVVSYGEMARVSDQVILSMPVGGRPDDPRLHAVTLAASLVDWPRTDRHAASTRYLRYVDSRAEADYGRLTTEVAAALNQIAQSSEPAAALALAEPLLDPQHAVPGNPFIAELARRSLARAGDHLLAGIDLRDPGVRRQHRPSAF